MSNSPSTPTPAPPRRRTGWKWGAIAAILAAVLMLLLLPRGAEREAGTSGSSRQAKAAKDEAPKTGQALAVNSGEAQVVSTHSAVSGPSLRERILARIPEEKSDPGAGTATSGAERIVATTPTRVEGMELDAGQLTPPAEKGVYTSLFGVESQGNNFAYVFDRSGSMGDPDSKPLRAAKAELLRSLEALGDLQQFQIIFYNERPILMQLAAQPGRLVLATTENKALAREHLERISAGGGTGHEEALSAALRLHPDVLYFLTDADEPALGGEQLSRIRRLNDALTKIHTIEFGRGPKRSAAGNFIEQLAKENGGEYRYVDVEGLEE